MGRNARRPGDQEVGPNEAGRLGHDGWVMLDNVDHSDAPEWDPGFPCEPLPVNSNPFVKHQLKRVI